MVYESFAKEDTFALGIALGSRALTGQVYCLSGGLGSGKTLFAKGFAKGLQIEEPVVSPTFTIVQIYEEGRMPLYHFDVYRIQEIEEMFEIGFEEYFYGRGVTLIEWAELVLEILPDAYTHILFETDLEKGTGYRKLTIEERSLT